MIDIHNHILFGIDDGASNLEESIAMLRQQESQGVTTVVVTPHFNPNRDIFESFLKKRSENVSILRSTLGEVGLSIKILVGCEVLFTTDLFEYDLSKLVIEGTDYILIEFSTKTTPGSVVQYVNRVISMGYIPIIAHIERYPFLKERLEDMVTLVNMGAVLQINADTFMNGEQKSFVKACIKHNLVHLIASDAHSTSKRKPNIGITLEYISKKYGDEFAKYLINNSVEIINNNDIDVYQPTQIQRFFGRYI